MLWICCKFYGWVLALIAKKSTVFFPAQMQSIHHLRADRLLLIMALKCTPDERQLISCGTSEKSSTHHWAHLSNCPSVGSFNPNYDGSQYTLFQNGGSSEVAFTMYSFAHYEGMGSEILPTGHLIVNIGKKSETFKARHLQLFKLFWCSQFISF